MKRILITGGLALGLLAFGAAAQSTPPQTQPDNTKVNKGDGSTAAATADRSKNDLTDRELTQKIRKSIVGDSSLSTYGHNVKVIAQGGQVTLKGPVRSEEEKKSIEQKAVEVAGSGNVADQLTIKPEKSK